jgi:hypothetical protein
LNSFSKSFIYFQKKKSLPKDKFLLPPNWEWYSDWEISSDKSSMFDKDANHTQFMDEVYEQQKRVLPGAGWVAANTDKAPFHWANYVI